MTASAHTIPHDAHAPGHGEIDARLRFIVRQQAKPYFESAAFTGGEPRVYFDTEDVTVRIRDARAIAHELSIERQGFELHRHETQVDDLYDDAAIAGVYERELETLLREITGGDRVVVFDYTRRSDRPQGAANPDGQRGPASRVHVDYTVASGPVRADDMLGAGTVRRVLDAGGRIAQINVWRPITGPVRRSPLALADARSIRDDELVATDQVFPDRVGEIYNVAHGPDQQWYWAPQMARDEVFLIKGWDTESDGRAVFTPHGAFPLPDQEPDAPARESIEARAYVIFGS